MQILSDNDVSFAGLELYENVLSPDEQTNMIHIIEDWVVQVSLSCEHVHFGWSLCSPSAAHI